MNVWLCIAFPTFHEHSNFSSKYMGRTSIRQSKVGDRHTSTSCLCLFAASCLRSPPVVVLYCFVSCLVLVLVFVSVLVLVLVLVLVFTCLILSCFVLSYLRLVIVFVLWLSCLVSVVIGTCTTVFCSLTTYLFIRLPLLLEDHRGLTGDGISRCWSWAYLPCYSISLELSLFSFFMSLSCLCPFPSYLYSKSLSSAWLRNYGDRTFRLYRSLLNLTISKLPPFSASVSV